jgi:hypothetical protein
MDMRSHLQRKQLSVPLTHHPHMLSHNTEGLNATSWTHLQEYFTSQEQGKTGRVTTDVTLSTYRGKVLGNLRKETTRRTWCKWYGKVSQTVAAHQHTPSVRPKKYATYASSRRTGRQAARHGRRVCADCWRNGRAAHEEGGSAKEAYEKRGRQCGKRCCAL